MFDINERIERIKARPDAAGIGMILAHQGIVRGTSKTGEPVTGMDLAVDRRRFDGALDEARGWDGVVAVEGWVNEGRLAVGDDIMKVVVAGDVRGNVIAALQRLVGIIKEEVVTEAELR
ncbi:MAG TPA: molybdenum cofactor biosynthesis protein MoaE [Thermoleophilia bacterium]|nr:molybdenum cofactor biosynthesis protein MoaE [Thermoleophilia bacterium]